MFKRRQGQRKQDNHAFGAIDTLIAAGCTLTGELRSTGSVRIDGSFKGTIAVDGDVVIGQDGKVSASIRARNLAVAGELHGDVVVDNRLELPSTGRLHGNVQMAVISLEEGALLEGECRMFGASSGRMAEVTARPPSRMKPESSCNQQGGVDKNGDPNGDAVEDMRPGDSSDSRKA